MLNISLRKYLEDAINSGDDNLKGTVDELKLNADVALISMDRNTNLTKVQAEIFIATVCNYLFESRGINIFDLITESNDSIKVMDCERTHWEIKMFLGDLPDTLEAIPHDEYKIVEYMTELIIIMEALKGECLSPKKNIIEMNFCAMCNSLIDNTDFDCPDDEAENCVIETIDGLLECFESKNFEKYPMLNDKLIVSVLNYYLVIKQVNYLDNAPQSVEVILNNYSDEGFVDYLKDFKKYFNKINDSVDACLKITELFKELVKSQESC